MPLTCCSYIYSKSHFVDCIYQPSIQTSIPFIKSSVSVFSYIKAGIKFALAVQKVKVNLGPSFEHLNKARDPDAVFQVSR